MIHPPRLAAREGHMLGRYLMRMKSRGAMVRDIFRKYLDSNRENSKITERRALAVSPDQERVLLNCFRLQDLLMERTKIRFEFLIKTKLLDCAPYKSLDAISERLDQEWTEADESVIKKSNSHYGDLSREIDDIRSRWDPDSLTDPLRALTQDFEYRAASIAHASKISKTTGPVNGSADYPRRLLTTHRNPVHTLNEAKKTRR